jgi:hypothetical protein
MLREVFSRKAHDPEVLKTGKIIGLPPLTMAAD